MLDEQVAGSVCILPLEFRIYFGEFRRGRELKKVFRYREPGPVEWAYNDDHLKRSIAHRYKLDSLSRILLDILPIQSKII